jgi:putative transposase
MSRNIDTVKAIYDLGYFDDETCRLEPIANPFGPKLLPMSPV